MKEFWNERFSNEEYVYGVEPNEFFREQISVLKPGKLLMPGEGEGRNAVYAATLGWDVTALDYSEQAMIKALQLAENLNVTIHYETTTLQEFKAEGYYDAVGLVFVHMRPDERYNFHRQVIASLRPGGVVIGELFHKNQLGRKSGGPPSLELLVSEDEIRSDFDGMEISLLRHKQVLLDEGPFHQGLADVVRLIARKPVSNT